MKYTRPATLFCLLFVATAHGQKAGPKKELPYYMRPQFAWTQDAWTADEKPFQSARVTLVMAQQQHKDMLALAKQYGAAAKAKGDALSVFRWGFAAWLASNYGTNHATGSELLDAYNALEKTPSPHSCQYDRLRYLIDVCCFSGYGMEALGDRLLKRNPYDYYVIYYQIGLLGGSLSKAKNERALELCKMLMEKDPRNPTGYERAARTYQNKWWGSKKKSDAQTAIDYYRKARTLLPANNPNQSAYDEQIGFIEHEMKQAH